MKVGSAVRGAIVYVGAVVVGGGHESTLSANLCRESLPFSVWRLLRAGRVEGVKWTWRERPVTPGR